MRTYLIELGMGTDLHKPDPTKCAVRAVTDAITRCSMVGVYECGLIKSMQELRVKIKIGIPHPEEVDRDAVLKVIPFGEREIEVVEGGLAEQGSLRKDGSRDSVMIGVAVVTVYVP